MLRKLVLFLLLLLFVQLAVPCCFADTENADTRYMVTGDMWATHPYNKFVVLEMGYNFFGDFVLDSHCSAQYVAPNLILSAGHCVGKNKTKYKAYNHKDEEFDLVLAYTEYGTHTKHVKGKDDWAVWLVKDPKYFSGTYFKPYATTKKTDFLHAGWGFLRILTNDEIDKIFNILYSIYGDEIENMDAKQIANILDTKLKQQNITSLIDARFKASRCHSIDCGGYSPNTYHLFMQCKLSCSSQTNNKADYDACVSQKCGELLKLTESYGSCDHIIDKYPDVIEHTCTTWEGDSGGGFVAENGNLYGIGSYIGITYGRYALTSQAGFMASSFQFESKIKELREIYSVSNTPQENLKRISKNTVLSTNDTNTLLEQAENEQFPQEEVAERIETLTQELAYENDDLLNSIKQSKSFNVAEKLQLLSDLTEHSVKSDQLAELQKAYEEAKEREQSLANRMLGGVTMALTGIGGMELAQGLAEQRADKDAEMDMTAYMETFRCEYSNGKNIKGGTSEIQLPSDNLFDLYQEYMTLAADVKERKEALGLKPGIESDVVLDKANTGLYDDKNTGITNGTYGSLYRAKMGNETDTEQVSDTKNKSENRKNIGIGLGATGVVGGTATNVLINNPDSELK